MGHCTFSADRLRLLDICSKRCKWCRTFGHQTCAARKKLGETSTLAVQSWLCQQFTLVPGRCQQAKCTNCSAECRWNDDVSSAVAADRVVSNIKQEGAELMFKDVARNAL